MTSTKKSSLRDIAAAAKARSARIPSGARPVVTRGSSATESKPTPWTSHRWPCPLFYIGNWNGEEPVRPCVRGDCVGSVEQVVLSGDDLPELPGRVYADGYDFLLNRVAGLDDAAHAAHLDEGQFDTSCHFCAYELDGGRL